MPDQLDRRSAKELRELAQIFRQWQKERDKHSMTEPAARKLVEKGLRRAAGAWPLISRAQSEFGLLSLEPQANLPTASNALRFVEEEKVGKNTDAIKRHRDFLVEEITTGSGSFLKDYLALANELDRWADVLESRKPAHIPDGWLDEKVEELIKQYHPTKLLAKHMAAIIMLEAGPLGYIITENKIRKTKAWQGSRKQK